METDKNNENAKSKIEQIRIDLEKKLAALEKAKLNVKPSNENSPNEIVNDVSNNIDDKIIKVKEQIDDNKSFIEQISDIEKSSIVHTDANIIKKEESITSLTNSNTIKDSVKNDEDTLFEIVDTIEQVKPDISNTTKVNKKEIQKTTNEKVESKPLTTIVPEKIEVSSKENNQPIKKKVIVPPIPNLTETNVIENEIENQIIEEKNESKGSKLNYLIYGLSALLLISLVYFAWDYVKDKNNLEKQQTEQLISEYENRRYLDSIEIADANNQLLDIQSQRFLDSMALVNQIQVVNANNSKNSFSKKSNFKKEKELVNPIRNRTKPTISAQDVTDFNNQRSEESKRFSNNENNKTSKTDLNSENPIANNIEKTNSNDNQNILNEVKTENNSNEVTNNTENTEIKPEKPKVQTLSTIEVSPEYPGCSGTESQKKKCLMTKISKFVARNFDADLANDLGLKNGRKRINVSFLIDKNGEPTVLKVRAQHEKLKKEAMRVVNSLPKMKPGKVNGKIEPVLYNLPIVYDVED